MRPTESVATSLRPEPHQPLPEQRKNRLKLIPAKTKNRCDRGLTIELVQQMGALQRDPGRHPDLCRPHERSYGSALHARIKRRSTQGG